MCQKSLVDLTDFRVLHMFYSNTVMTYPKTHFCGTVVAPRAEPGDATDVAVIAVEVGLQIRLFPTNRTSDNLLKPWDEIL